MARAASAPKKEISMEEALWKSADKLRGSVEPAEYKHVVLSLFFLKFASDKFEAQRKAISEKYGEKFVDNVAFYTKDNVFFLPEISRWSFIILYPDIQEMIDFALDCTGLILGVLTDVNRATQYSNIDDWEGTLMLARLGLKYQEYDFQQSEKAFEAEMQRQLGGNDNGELQ